jgi:hypothetical protein
MVSTRKEEQRRLNREAGVLKYWATMEDESPLLDGLFVCEVEWKGDQPILRHVTGWRDERNDRWLNPPF